MLPAVPGQFPAETVLQPAQMDHGGVLQGRLVQHVQGQAADAAAKMGDAPLPVPLHLNGAEGRIRAGNFNHLAVREPPVRNICPDEIRHVGGASYGGNQPGSPPQLLKGRGRHGRDASAGMGNRRGGDPLIGCWRRVNHQEGVFGRGANE